MWINLVPTWAGITVMFVGLIAFAVITYLLHVRASRVVTQQLSELTRRVEGLQVAIGALSRERLCELLPEECDASLKVVQEALYFFRSVERSASPEELGRMKRRSGEPFTVGLEIGKPLLISQILGESLAALRAVKARYHSGDPMTFSREPKWVYGGRHDGLRKKLRGEVSGSDDPSHRRSGGCTRHGRGQV